MIFKRNGKFDEKAETFERKYIRTIDYKVLKLSIF